MEKTEVPDLSEMARLVLPELRRMLKEKRDVRDPHDNQPVGKDTKDTDGLLGVEGTPQ